MRYFAIVVSSILMCGSSLAASVNSATIPELADALNTRFEVMKDVAGYKAANQLPVEDLPREKEVLLKAQNAARDAMLDPESIEEFVQTQMAVSKNIQYRYLDRWRLQPEKAWQPRPLAEVRAQILELDNAILNLISRQILTGGGFGEEQDRTLAQLINDKQISPLEKAQLIDALGKIKRR
ncbi:chorismate mutase [Enterobacter cloacae]|uniref:chorismate mutase n=1 Tax=Enterobacter cloacae TaxID=550 RepID=UPI0021843627|nr:chorismate mutase [Enterobacter cloacae]EMC0022870.1 chorismate mutase [Enterobacter cloacae]MCT2767048.1 chorismate mutase [Enterobacter cloacae]MDR1750056.1 chorismate mutase [Enterobacter cloacae]HDC4528613.1 chorismate mutase [Enterobacter cloacae]